MSSHYEAIVAGAGHNGLTTACYLAKAGLKVLVVEKNDYIGGATVSRELYEGWIYSNCSYVNSLLRPEIVRDLDLPRYGLQVTPYAGGATFMRDGGYFAHYDNHDALRREIARFSKKDVDAHDRYVNAVMRQCRFIKPVLLHTPPDPTSFKLRDIQELLYMAKRFHDLGAKEMGEMIRFWTMSIGEFLDEFFETDVIKAHLAGSGIIGTGLGVYSPGTAYVLLHHYMGEVDGSIGAWGFTRGGMGGVSKALAGALHEAGGEIKVGSGVEKFFTSGGKAAGVVLENGDTYYAPIVISSFDVRRTFLKHVDQNELDDDFIKAVKRYKFRGSSGKINIALDGPPVFPAAPKGAPFLRGDLHCSDSLAELEVAYDDWKAGKWSREPYFDMLIPTYIDPTMAPPGKHMMTLFTQYAPYKIADGRPWNEETREEFAETVISKIENVSPGFRDLILHKEVRSPWDIENEVGLGEGNIFQGELTFDQMLFNRPVPGYAQYRSPIRGLWMCGSSNHPGGGVMAAPGANAAREILRELKKKPVGKAA